MTKKKEKTIENEIEMENKDCCFIVTPIGADDSNERRFADGITRAVLQPVLEDKGFTPVAAHQILSTGSINKQVIDNLYNAKLVIANLTGLNPNVMYEVGIRYTMRKHMILICEEGTRLPFDIIDERTIFYKNDIAGSEELKIRLSDMLDEINYDEPPDNPVFRALDLQNAMGELSNDNSADIILKELKSIINTSNNERVNNQKNSMPLKNISVLIKSNNKLTDKDFLMLKDSFRGSALNPVSYKFYKQDADNKYIYKFLFTFDTLKKGIPLKTTLEECLSDFGNLELVV